MGFKKDKRLIHCVLSENSDVLGLTGGQNLRCIEGRIKI